MTKRFELLVFDWDGTLSDSTATIVAAIQAASRDLGLAEPPAARVREIIGLSLVESLRRALPELPPQRYGEMAERYRHHYFQCDREMQLFAGAAELVAELAGAGYLLAVATGKSRTGLERALALSGLGAHFQDTRCSDDCFSKPHPQMLEELMTAFGVAPAQTLMIGDTTHDLQMAANAGVASLAVSYGAHAPEVLAAHTPLACLDSVGELAQWLRKNG